MKYDIKSKLDAAFEKHEASERTAAEVQQDRESKEQVFLREFIQVRKSVVRPAMEEIGEYVEGKGYSYDISTEDDRPSPHGRGRSTPASITLTILLGGERRYPLHEHPGLSVICDKDKRKVRFHESVRSPGRGGHSGPAGEAELPDLTTDFVQERIVNVVAQVFR
jgi:hypothetical protein